MKGYNQARDPEPTGVEETEVARVTESVPVPWIVGTRKVAVTWISRVYNIRAKTAPQSRPGKK